MGELAAPGHVADGIDPLVAGPQGLVRPDPRPVERDAGFFEIEPLRRRPAADRDQQVRARNPRLSVGTLDDQDRSVGVRLDTDGPGPGTQFDVVRAKLIQHHLRGLRILAAQHFGALDNDDLRAEATEGLAQLHPDRTTAQNDEPARTFTQFEDRLIGQIRDGLKPRDRRNGGARPRGDDDLARPYPDIAADHRAVVDKPGRRTDDAHTEALEAFLAVDRRDGGDGPVDMGHDRGEIDDGIRRANSEPGRAGLMRLVRRGDQGLGRHTAVIQAVAAHLALFEQHHLEPQLGRARGDRQSARAGADDDQIDLERFRHRLCFRCR